MEEVDTHKLRSAHVSQLARFKTSEAAKEDGVATRDLDAVDPTGARSDAQWKKVDKGTKIVFHRKQDPASHLRVAEVLELDKAERKLTVWYYIHSSSDYDVERPLKLWNCTPEWYNDSNTTVIHPKPAQKEKLHMRDDVFEFEDIDLIAGGISLQRGKLPEHVITLADEWLLRASKVERRALRARSNPVT